MKAQNITNGTATAEIIFTRDQVHTVNATHDVVEAVAVSGGRIVAAGGNAHIRALAVPDTREVMLGERLLLPGFIDAHCQLTGLSDERLRIGTFKVTTDGSSSGSTVTTREPYVSSGQNYGIFYWDQEGLDDLLGRAHRQSFQCTVHAVGDRAIEQTLNAIARAQREFPRGRLRHHVPGQESHRRRCLGGGQLRCAGDI